MRPSVLLFVLAGLSCLGCGPTPNYYVETEIHTDGKIDRAIIQPLESVRGGARSEKRWDKSGFLEGRPSGELEDLRAVTLTTTLPEKKEDQYFAGWRQFKTAAEIPDHLTLDDEGHTTSLRRSYARRDFGLFIEHVWLEQLPNTISLADALVARRELAKLVCDRTEFIFKDGLREYDCASLIQWMRTDGTVWFEKLCQAQIQAHLFPNPQWGEDEKPDQLEQFIFGWANPVCAEYGLKFHALESVPERNVENARILKEFLHGMIRKHIQRRDAKALKSAELDVLGEAVTSGLLLKDHKDLEKQPELIRSVKKATDAYLAAHPEHKEAMSAFVQRIWGFGGPLGIGLFQQASQFSFRIKLPGEVISSDGMIAGAHDIEWKFRTAELFPLGKSMAARSIERQEFNVPELHPSITKLSALRLAQLVDLVGNDTDLRTALQDCRASKSLEPLDQFLKEHDSQMIEHETRYASGTAVKEWLTTGAVSRDSKDVPRARPVKTTKP